MGNTESYSDLLFAQPSFMEGVGSLVDLGWSPEEYNSSLTPEQADSLALESDWRAIGQDLWSAMRQFASEHKLPVMKKSK